MVWVAQRPGFVRIEMRVAPYARSWEISVRQEASLSVERWAVTVKARGKYDGNVHVTFAAFQSAVRHCLKTQRRDALPYVKRPANGLVGFSRAHFGSDIFNAGKQNKQILR